ncbi:E3 ubiquitin-protein ligase TRIM39-like [Amblyraja radiata]|uniref:E3 ubiquitin-protein ligase TRIM39-like n=1 Tax=Amblyraja radiata TaxID=386614 RepID=UPI0014026159|nr:E3 ubiquitin-protein ligase TRIM39-like [Amblyraja radiata]
MAHLYTFAHTFSETLYPYFCLCLCLTDRGKNAEPMKICRFASQSRHHLPGESGLGTVLRQSRLSEKARTLSLNRTVTESKHHCEKHLEELKLFCETDKKVICLICRDAREHKSHSFIPIEEAVEIYKEQVNSSFESLTKKKSEIEQMEQQQKEKISVVLEESHNLQSQITSQFSELHQIFTEKERRVLADIREEEMKIRNSMEKRLQEIQANLNSIQKELSTLQEQIDQKDNRIFLKEETGRRRRVSDEINSLSVTDGALPIENIHHHFVLNTLWRETCAIQRVSVTLDVETAHARLEVSVDRKRVRWTRTQRGLPDTRKRFTDWPCVLGSEGFTSGRYYWEVEVGGSRYWCLGIAAESVERKGPVPLTPETGGLGGLMTSLMHSPPLHPVSPPVPSPGGWEFISVTSPGQFHFTTRTPSPISTHSLGINSRRNFILSSGLGIKTGG